MFSEYDKKSINDIHSKTGIGINKVEKYYIANGCDIEKTLKDIQNKIDLGIIDIIGTETGSVISNNVNLIGDSRVDDKNSLIQIELTSNK